MIQIDDENALYLKVYMIGAVSLLENHLKLARSAFDYLLADPTKQEEFMVGYISISSSYNFEETDGLIFKTECQERSSTRRFFSKFGDLFSILKPQSTSITGAVIGAGVQAVSFIGFSKWKVYRNSSSKLKSSLKSSVLKALKLTQDHKSIASVFMTKCDLCANICCIKICGVYKDVHDNFYQSYLR